MTVAGVAFVGIGLISPVNASQAGNNGTIKVDGAEFDSHPDNEPHVGCGFQIDFYGFEASIPVSMTFTLQEPTGTDVIYTEDGTLDDDDATGGGSQAGLDGQFTIDLTDALDSYEPQPNQGYHVKLTITADDGDPYGSQVKHKVYWVTGCGDTTTTTTSSTTTTTEGTTTTESTTTTTGSPPATVGPNTTERPPGGTEVLGIQLARTGSSRTLIVVGAVLLAAGLVIELAAQRAKHQAAVR
jgi:hypothetical protein